MRLTGVEGMIKPCRTKYITKSGAISGPTIICGNPDPLSHLLAHTNK